MKQGREPDPIPRYAGMLQALGNEPRLRIVRLLLEAYPDGMVVNQVQEELGIAASTLSHHLEKLKNEELVTVSREGTFLRYNANAEALREVLQFLFSSCCSRSTAVKAESVIQIGKR
ncbi:MAG: winged helix-turn-helix transcriptional regulator [Acidobacteria bacterium]|nr:winged helix-turn-helix transcriptional regulator [Acidobacteriota bacterium]